MPWQTCKPPCLPDGPHPSLALAWNRWKCCAASDDGQFVRALTSSGVYQYDSDNPSPEITVSGTSQDARTPPGKYVKVVSWTAHVQTACCSNPCCTTSATSTPSMLQTVRPARRVVQQSQAFVARVPLPDPYTNFFSQVAGFQHVFSKGRTKLLPLAWPDAVRPSALQSPMSRTSYSHITSRSKRIEIPKGLKIGIEIALLSHDARCT